MRASRGDRTPATRSPRQAGPASRRGARFPSSASVHRPEGRSIPSAPEDVPGDTGMAFVLLQHLSPDHGSALVELLATCTPMRVCEIVDGTTVEANRVYVIPPDRDVALSAGRLVLLPRTTTHGLHMPVDHFLRSLAEERQDAAIAVILSGTGVGRHARCEGGQGRGRHHVRAGAGFGRSRRHAAQRDRLGKRRSRPARCRRSRASSRGWDAIPTWRRQANPARGAAFRSRPAARTGRAGSGGCSRSSERTRARTSPPTSRRRSSAGCSGGWPWRTSTGSTSTPGTSRAARRRCRPSPRTA